MTTRQQRNADYRRAGAPALQDADPEPAEWLSLRWWAELVTIIAIGSIVAVGIFRLLELMGL